MTPSGSQNGAPPSRRVAWRRGLVGVVAVALLLLGRVVATGRLVGPAEPDADADAIAGLTVGPREVAPTKGAPGASRGAGEPDPDGAPPEGASGATPGGEEATRAVWQMRLARAEATLRNYLESTRYPPGSRPMYEHPDQADLPAPERSMPLDRDDPDDPAGVRLKVRQSRVFLAGDESVTYEIACERGQGEPAPCTVEGYTGLAEHYGPGAPQVPAPFVAGADGATWAATLTPSRDGFAGLDGTLRTWARVRAGSDERAVFFDVLFTSSPPARFTGRVDEWLEQGSLVLGLELEVARPGRYVVVGRVDDADREPLALVTFNEELEAGRRVVPLVLFGKLVLDLSARFPLVLRDVQAFRLREEGDPDRELLPTRSGEVHVTKVYPPTAFSDAEWQSEERDRYVRELTSDVKRARDGAAPP